MTIINPYINFNNNAEEAANFYQSIFGGEIEISYVKDSPFAVDSGEEMQNKVFHGTLKGELIHIMFSDMNGPEGYKQGGGNIAMAVACENKEQITNFFEKLSARGTVIMPLGESSWNSLFAGVHDNYGVAWFLNCDNK
jgi:PhnB protein